MDANKHKHVALTGGNKNPKVLKKDRQFDKEDRGGVDDRGDINPLKAQSANCAMGGRTGTKRTYSRLKKVFIRKFQI